MATRDPASPALPDLLALLVGDGPDSTFAFGVSLCDGTETVELSVCDLPASIDPVSSLVGMVAPASWDAFGVVSGAIAHASGKHEQVWLGALVDRNGEVFASIRNLDGNVDTVPQGCEGQLVDLCRRVLKLPCAPPDETAVPSVLAALWCAAIDDFLQTHPAGASVGWDDLAVIHPANILLPDSLAPLSERARHVASEVCWADLRRACVDRRLTIGDILPEDAAWFDDGSFSGWVLRQLPRWQELYPFVIEGVDYEVGSTLLDHIVDMLSGTRKSRQS